MKATEKKEIKQSTSKIRKATTEAGKKLSAIGKFLASNENKGEILDMRAVLK